MSASKHKSILPRQTTRQTEESVSRLFTDASPDPKVINPLDFITQEVIEHGKQVCLFWATNSGHVLTSPPANLNLDKRDRC